MKLHAEPEVPVLSSEPNPLRRVSEQIARMAFVEYEHQHGYCQSFEMLHERGGFSASELVELLASRIERLDGRTDK